MINISEYQNFREYLKDYYEHKKKSKDGFTYAKFSKKAGIQSPNYFKLVTIGEKNLTPQNIIRFSKALELNDNESDYFESLVHFNQARNALEKEYYQTRMNRSRSRLESSPNKKTLKEYEFEMMSNWLYHAIMVLTNIDGFIASPSWIRERLFGLSTEEEISSILNQLETLKMLTRDSFGKLRQTFREVKTQPELQRLSARNFYKGLLERTIQSLTLPEHGKSETAAVLVGLSANQIEELKKRVRSFMKDLNDWALENSNPGQVYALTFFGFPLTTPNSRRNQ